MARERKDSDVSSLVGTVLCRLRKRHGLTQMGLAEKSGIARSSIAAIEQGVNDPSWSTVVALAETLGVDVGEFNKEPGVRNVKKRGRPWD